jgi:glycosyltransferase involved in cell wall biosynthesis
MFGRFPRRLVALLPRTVKTSIKRILGRGAQTSGGDPEPAIVSVAANLEGKVIRPAGPLEMTFPLVYSFLEARDYGVLVDEATGEASEGEIVINWVTPNFDLVSGGMRIAFELMAYLEGRGFKNNLYIFGGTHYKDGEDARRAIAQNYRAVQADVFLGLNSVRSADILIAVGWQCAWPVRNALRAPLKVFLVQDFEAQLYASGSEYVLAEAPLGFGFYGLALGPWAQKVAVSHGMRSTPFDMAVDERNFYPRAEMKRKRDRIVFYGRFVTQRRAFELGVVALDLVRKARPSIEIIFHGWSNPSASVPFEFIDCGIMSDDRRGELYASSTIGLALSLTNASIVPLEMMACELPVVELRGDNTTTFDGENHEDLLCLSQPHPRALANAILRLLDDEPLRERLGRQGAAFVRERTWEKAGAVVEEALRRELEAVRASPAT